MARRRGARPAAAVVPPRLLERPSTPEAITAWDPDQGDEISAFYRWIDARRAWCEQAGMDYRTTFGTLMDR